MKLKPTGKSSPKHLPKGTRGFGIARSPFDFENSMKKELVPTRKSSPKHLPKTTRGFGSAGSPYSLRKSQLNNFHTWHVDSAAPTAPVDLEIVNKNYIAIDSEIITETPFKGDAWFRNSCQPLLIQKKWTKTGSVLIGKWSLKHFSKGTCGFRRAASTCWLRKSQWKRSRCRLENHHRNTFQRWCVDSE